jgi:cobalt/nickel transport protein
MVKKNLILLTIAVGIIIFTLVYQYQAPFEGTDVLAQAAILEISTSYEPWFKPITKPPSAEVESLVFSLQAALGAGILGVIFGRMTQRDPESEHQAK